MFRMLWLHGGMGIREFIEMRDVYIESGKRGGGLGNLIRCRIGMNR